MDSFLGAYRALDLSDETGFLCGKILGDLGADVIKIEKPGGDPSRNRGPFYHDIPDANKSLYWFAYNTSKRGITLNIDTADGQEIFKRLVQSADFIIESFPPGYMDELSLGYSALSELNPRIIMTSITPFGQSGPYRDYKACDIVSMAMGGLMYICGDPDRPPIRCSVPQSYPQAGAHAAAGTLVAHYHRQMTEVGQHIDVSIQECIVRTVLMEMPQWEYSRFLVRRYGPKSRRANVFQREVWRCKNGQVCFRLMGGVYGRGIQPLVDWMKSEGRGGAAGEVEDWTKVDIAKLSQETSDAWEQAFADFFMQHTAEELHEEAVNRRFYLFPSSNPEQLVKDKQLAARDYWVEVEHAELGGTITYPGAPYKCSLPLWRIQCRAPLIGEHNKEIYQDELGFSAEELSTLKEANVI